MTMIIIKRDQEYEQRTATASRIRASTISRIRTTRTRTVMIHNAGHFAAWVLNNPWTLAPMCIALVFVPVLGMWAVHKYGWEHWEPFDKHHD